MQDEVALQSSVLRVWADQSSVPGLTSKLTHTHTHTLSLSLSLSLSLRPEFGAGADGRGLQARVRRVPHLQGSGLGLYRSGFRVWALGFGIFFSVFSV